MAITARKPKRTKCPECRKLVNRKNFARHLKVHRREKQRWEYLDAVDRLHESL